VAGLLRLKDGRRVVKWYQAGKECRLSLGRVSGPAAEAARVHVAELLDAAQTNRPIQPATVQWLAELTPRRHARLDHYGLAVPREFERAQWLAGMCDHIRRIKLAEVGPTSQQAYEKILHNLTAFFGDCLLKTITRHRVNEFRRWLETSANRRTGGGLAAATVNKRLKTCREWWRIAQREGWIDQNPFDHLKGLEEHAAGPESRRVYVPRPVIAELIDHTPDVEWRLILALWRFAGLRETEPWFLTWEMVDFERSRMQVFAPKQRTERKRWRTIPIWPEVAPHLADQFEAAPSGTVHVIYRKRYRVDTGKQTDVHAAGANARSRLEKHLIRCGHLPWPRLVQNLRASGETDQINAGKFSPFTVATWWNHNRIVQEKHYLTVPESEFDRAISTRPPSTEPPKTRETRQ